MAGATYRNSGKLTYASRSNTAITAPSGTAAGDILLAFFCVGQSSSYATVTTPAGYALARGTWPAGVNVAGFYVNCYLWYRVADGTSGDNCTTSHSALSTQMYLVSISGADTSSINNTFDPAPTQANGTGSTSTVTTLTTAVDNSLVLFLEQDWGDYTNNLTGPTGSNPTFNATNGDTPRIAPNSTSGILFGNDGQIAAASTATGNKSITNNNNPGTSPSPPWQAFLVCVAGAAAAAASVPKRTLLNQAIRRASLI